MQNIGEAPVINPPSVFELAKAHTPAADIRFKDEWRRHDIVSILSGSKNIGLELGVARGIYSRRMLDSGKFSRFFGVDVYGDIHNTDEYKHALRTLDFKDPKYCLLRMGFEDALDLFDDDYFDFIYIDGFAHTGEEGGKTMIDWYRKLKVGGVFAGDDYHEDWPLVVWAVNHFSNEVNAPVWVTTHRENEGYSLYPTWFMTKQAAFPEPSLDLLLYKIGIEERDRVHRERMQEPEAVREETLLTRLQKMLRLKAP